MTQAGGHHSGESSLGLRRLFDWFTALPPDEAEAFRDQMMATVMLRPAALLLSGAGILLMSGTAAMLLQRPWAIGWFIVDLVMLVLRVSVAVRYQRRGAAIPGPVARVTVGLTILVLLVFALGCAASFMTAIRPLPMIATTAMMALIAGLATRMAALPRLAIPAITVFSVPFLGAILFADKHHFLVGAPQFVIVAAGTAALTLQNHRAIVAMLRAKARADGLAVTDVLTGLPNRGGLLRRLERRRDAGTTGMALLFVDMDRFKTINDRFGHGVGDQVLIETARRLRRVASPHFICRLGGDEFVVMIEGRDVATASTTARRIADDLARPFEDLADQPIETGASVGIAFGSTALGDAEQVLADADRALYLAKRAGGGREAVVQSAISTAA
jgi:diguanylate cyclase (GGDEF)-like protein